MNEEAELKHWQKSYKFLEIKFTSDYVIEQFVDPRTVEC